MQKEIKPGTWLTYDEVQKTWCLSGSTSGGLYWETDDVDAETAEQAEADAIEYMEANA